MAPTRDEVCSHWQHARAHAPHVLTGHIQTRASSLTLYVPAELCKEKGVKGFPTWEINGKIESGVKPLAKLAEMIGYKSAPGL